MSKINDGGQAFPCLERVRNDGLDLVDGGMTLRDYFAAKAMQAFIAGISNVGGVIPCNDERVSERAYNIADAMLKARDEGGAK